MWKAGNSGQMSVVEFMLSSVCLSRKIHQLCSLSPLRRKFTGSKLPDSEGCIRILLYFPLMYVFIISTRVDRCKISTHVDGVSCLYISTTARQMGLE